MGFDSRLNESLITGTTGVISSSTILRKRRVIRWQVGLEKHIQCFFQRIYYEFNQGHRRISSLQQRQLLTRS